MLADVALAQTVPITIACGSDDVMAQEIDEIDVPCGHRFVVVSGLRLGGAAEQPSWLAGRLRGVIRCVVDRDGSGC